MIRRIIYFLIATLVLGGLAAAIAFYAFDFKPKMLTKVILGAPRPTETVAAEPARTEAWQPQVTAIGTLSAVEGIELSPQVGGIVQEIGFDSGQMVKKGQLLLKLKSETEEADVRGLEPQLKNAQTELSRKQVLIDKGLSPRNELDALQMQTLTLQANIEKLQAVIAQKTITAPWDGTVGMRTLSQGSYVAAGKPIVWLQKIDPINADFPVTEQDYARIKPGQKVTASFSAWPDVKVTGEVTTNDAKMSEQSRMITIRARLANPDMKLLPGMYADIVVAAGAPQDVVTVPATAVTYSLYGDSVFIATAIADTNSSENKEANPQYQVERRFIKAGEVRDGRVAIISGLKIGEMVVTAGQNKIDQGAKVVINNSIALKASDSSVNQ